MRHQFVASLLVCLLLSLVAVAAGGYYFNDPSGYGSWWVGTGQTPPEGLYYATAGAGVCVDSSLIRSLERQFPGDPFVNMIPSVHNGAVCSTAHTGTGDEDDN